MKGHIRQRGKLSCELKFDAGHDPATGRRKIQYHAFRGSKRDAQVKLAELIASVGRGSYVEPSRVHVDRKVIEVREALEQTKAHGIRVKSPKSKAGRRDITLPDILVDALRDHRRKQLELRMQLGAGRLADDALLFSDLDNNPLSPNAVSALWHEFAKSAGMAEISFHALRHSHASQLIDAGVDIVTISTRLGHAKSHITLRTYAHLFRKDDGKAAAAINLALAGIS